MTLSINQISDGVREVAAEYPLRKVILFGSYADGTCTDSSDVDLLVVFDQPYVSLLTLSALKYSMQDVLGKDVDVIHGPLNKDAMIDVGKEISIYES